MNRMAEAPAAARIPIAARGWRRLRWIGPGFLWMVSAAGSGELLFTPRVGALYGYVWIWAMGAAVIFKWFINREIGRFTVCTGATVLDGFKCIPGPKNWAVWIIVVPQLVVAIATIAGLAGSSATALLLVLHGDVRIWMVASVLTATSLVLWGRYRAVEWTATALGIALAAAAIAAAISVSPDPTAIASGLIPRFPAEVDYGEVLPWLGFMLSGAAGMLWYSYWVRAKGYGAAALARVSDRPLRPATLGYEDRARLRGWVAQMTLDTTVAVVGTLVIALAFLILGTELLRPRGLVPEEDRIAGTLGHLLGSVWGPMGFWFMITAVFIGFWDTVLSDQDGFGRLFGDGARTLLQPLHLPDRWLDEAVLKNVFVVVVLTVLPIVLYLMIGEPVGLLKVAGAIEAAHIPIVTGLVLYLNRRWLPRDLRPSHGTLAATGVAGMFFAGFAGIYVFQLVGR
jgi:Mn2+/Fe2+ NRAMP family transporter